MPEYSSPLGMPINTGDSGLLVKSEEYLAGCLYENKIKEVSITVPVKQPTSHSCASRLFAFCQLTVYILPVGYFRQTANLIIGHKRKNYMGDFLIILHIALGKHIIRQGFQF